MAGYYQNRARRWLSGPEIDRNSIQGRLTLLAGLIFLVTWVGASIISNIQGFRNTQAILEREAAFVAQLVLAVEYAQLDLSAFHESPSLHSLQVWRDDALIASKGPIMLESRPGAQALSKDIAGSTWVFAQRCAGERCVVYGASHQRRQQGFYCLAASIFGPIFMIVAIGFGLTILSIRHALRPINLFARRVETMNIERPDLVKTFGQQKEFAPLINAINALGERVRSLLERERMFLGGCAHEIRTPLAGLMGQLQLAGDNERLENARTCAARTARVADQFLTFAASKSLHAFGRRAETFDLCETIRDAIAPFASHAEAEIEMTGPDAVDVKAHAFALSAIASNLVQNALKYGKPSGSAQRISIHVATDGVNVVLSVEDNGPGLTKAEMLRALDEFERIDPQKAQMGAGLGLSIVNEIAAQYGGEATLSKSPLLGGLKVRISLPIAASLAHQAI